MKKFLCKIGIHKWWYLFLEDFPGCPVFYGKGVCTRCGKVEGNDT